MPLYRGMKAIPALLALLAPACLDTTGGLGRVIVGVTSQIVNSWDAKFAGLVGAESFAGWFTANVIATP